MKKVINRGKRSKTLSEVKPVENISRNPLSFLEISPVQKEVLLSHELKDHAFEQYNLFGLKEDNPSEKLPESIESSKFVLHRARMSGFINVTKP